MRHNGKEWERTGRDEKKREVLGNHLFPFSPPVPFPFPSFPIPPRDFPLVGSFWNGSAFFLTFVGFSADALHSCPDPVFEVPENLSYTRSTKGLSFTQMSITNLKLTDDPVKYVKNLKSWPEWEHERKLFWSISVAFKFWSRTNSYYFSISCEGAGKSNSTSIQDRVAEVERSHGRLTLDRVLSKSGAYPMKFDLIVIVGGRHDISEHHCLVPEGRQELWSKLVGS